MTTEQSKPQTQRVKLAIKEVQEPKEYKPGRKVINFTATAPGAEKPLRYGCFRDSIFPHLIAGQTIEADVETRSRASDDPDRPFIDRTVQQVYVDGQPIGGQKGFPAGRQGWGKTPEQQAEERRSIEGQVALKEVGELVRAGIAVGDLKKLYLDILWAKLHEFAHQSASPPPPGGATAPLGQAPTPRSEPVPPPGQPGEEGEVVHVQQRGQGAAASAPTGGTQQPPATGGHPAAPHAFPGGWPECASFIRDLILEPSNLEASGFLKFSESRLQRSIRKSSDFANYDEALAMAYQYVASQQEKGT